MSAELDGQDGGWRLYQAEGCGAHEDREWQSWEATLVDLGNGSHESVCKPRVDICYETGNLSLFIQLVRPEDGAQATIAVELENGVAEWLIETLQQAKERAEKTTMEPGPSGVCQNQG